MARLVKVTDFKVGEDGGYSANLGCLTIELTNNGFGKWSVGVDEYETVLVPPCHEEYFETPVCGDGKDLDEIEDFDACELTCPCAKREVETLICSSYHWCMSLEDAILDARKTLVSVDEQYGERCFTPELADMFRDSKWLIGGVLY